MTLSTSETESEESDNASRVFFVVFRDFDEQRCDSKTAWREQIRSNKFEPCDSMKGQC